MDHRRIFIEQILPLKNNLFRYSFSFLNDKQKSEDVVQETMLRLWRIRETWPEIQNMLQYGLGITRHLCLDEIRRKRIVFTEIETIAELSAGNQGPWEDFSNKELKEQLLRTLALLPEKQRQCFHLREIEGFSYTEIASALQISLDQVKVNIYRARNLIRAHLFKTSEYATP